MKKGFWDTSNTIHYSPPMQHQEWDKPKPLALPGYRETPMGQADTIASGVAVPALQGTVVGLFPGVFVTIVIGTFTVFLSWPWYTPILLGLATWTGIASWRVWNFVEKRQALLWQIEKIEGRDIDGDGYIGKPLIEPVTVQVEVKRPDTNYPQMLNLRSATADKLRVFAGKVLGGRGLGIGEWTGNGGLFSRTEYERVRGEMLEFGLFKWVSSKDKRQGLKLTAKGKAVFRELSTSPLPE